MEGKEGDESGCFLSRTNILALSENRGKICLWCDIDKFGDQNVSERTAYKEYCVPKSETNWKETAQRIHRLLCYLALVTQASGTE
jgi:hypothetical protein